MSGTGERGGHRVNVGCGMTPTPGWLNLDNSPTIRLAARPWLNAVGKFLLSAPQRQYLEFCRSSGIAWADASTRLPLADDSCDVVYSCHMLEHLDLEEAETFLSEAHRVLRTGGILRIAVPDLRKHVDRYIESRDADRFIRETHLGRAKPRGLRNRLASVLIGDRSHHWMYDGPSLSSLLERNGFRAATVLAPGETTIPDPGPLDLRERADESVYVEATKG
jgi:SAM-dependent methyltransferase